ncbi:hypothetical protein C2E23DRAFT_898179 [Lenzites betulinus]|nr:hypothetical protein C2E23DRAFT_898179 [Lenzites betulinus]
MPAATRSPARESEVQPAINSGCRAASPQGRPRPPMKLRLELELERESEPDPALAAGRGGGRGRTDRRTRAESEPSRVGPPTRPATRDPRPASDPAASSWAPPRTIRNKRQRETTDESVARSNRNANANTSANTPKRSGSAALPARNAECRVDGGSRCPPRTIPPVRAASTPPGAVPRARAISPARYITPRVIYHAFNRTQT